MNLLYLVIAYVAGLLVTNHLILAWTHSNFPQHLWNCLHSADSAVYTKDDLTTAALRYGSWGDLWVCPLCLGTWIGLVVATIVTWFSFAPPWFIFLGAFSWAGLLYPIHKKI